MKKFVLAAALIAFSSTSAFAAGNTSTATGSASAVIVGPITLTHTTGDSLNFGAVISGTAGTVAVTSGGVATYTTVIQLAAAGTPSADGFAVSGDAGRAFSIATTNSTITNGTTSLSFTTSPSAASGTLTGTAGSGTTGTAAFTVGGTLTVTAAATAGTYTGTYSATVTYS